MEPFLAIKILMALVFIGFFAVALKDVVGKKPHPKRDEGENEGRD